jgi:heptosyltransferase-2
VTYDKHRWAAKDVYDNAKFLKADGYDLAIILPNSFEAALTSFVTRIPRRIGYNKDVRGLLLTDPIAVPEWKNRRHEVYYYLNLIAETERRVLGRETISIEYPNISLEVSPERRAKASRILAEAGVRKGFPIVALGVGSTNSRAKRWPAERYAELSDRLRHEFDANVILVGSPQETDVAETVVGLSASKPINLVGKTDLAQATAILSTADLMIANDMGLGHVAAAVGCRVVTIFGPTNPDTTQPYAMNASIIREPVECSPCMLRDCPIDHRCMTRISVDMVAEIAGGIILYRENVSEPLTLLV